MTAGPTSSPSPEQWSPYRSRAIFPMTYTCAWFGIRKTIWTLGDSGGISPGRKTPFFYASWASFWQFPAFSSPTGARHPHWIKIGWRTKLQRRRANGTNMKRTIPEPCSEPVLLDFPVAGSAEASPSTWRPRLTREATVGLTPQSRSPRRNTKFSLRGKFHSDAAMLIRVAYWGNTSSRYVRVALTPAGSNT